MRRVLVLAWCGGCAGGSLELSPNPLTWAEPVDFHDADPPECDGDAGGCAPQALDLTNVGTADLIVRVPGGFDGGTLCFVGFPKDTPVEIPVLSPNQTYSLIVSVCGYPQGSLDSPVEGTLTFTTDGKPASVNLPFSYTPTRDIPVDDSGF